jgi:hypothetical protein
VTFVGWTLGYPSRLLKNGAGRHSPHFPSFLSEAV